MKVLLSIFNYSVKKLSNLESRFSNSDTSWKNNTSIILAETLRMVIYLSKNLLKTQSFFIVWKKKTNDFRLRKNRIMGKEVDRDQDRVERCCLCSKVLAKLSPRAQKLYQITYIFCKRLWSFFIQPFDTNLLASPLCCSKFGEPNYVFKRYVYIVAYLGIMLQASWHISEGN